MAESCRQVKSRWRAPKCTNALEFGLCQSLGLAALASVVYRIFLNLNWTFHQICDGFACMLEVYTMAPIDSALAKRSAGTESTRLNPAQTLRASTALLRKIQSDQSASKPTTGKADLLADSDDECQESTPIWLVLGTKKHIIDKKRLKPGKITLPHPYHSTSTNPDLKICLITTDPQRTYKDLITDPSFPLDVSKRIGRVIGLKKLKAKYSSFESRRKLSSEYDVFLADDRIITYLPQVLGKAFYKSGTKRPIPVTLEGRRQNFDEQGNKRRKLSEGGSKVIKSAVRPADVAREIERAVSSTLVHLAPSTSTAVKVGNSGMEPSQIQENVEAVVQSLAEKYVPQKWNNVRSIHIKGPDTAALPIWLAEELWEDEGDVLEEAPAPLEGKKGKKRKRGALADAAGQENGEPEVIMVPGGDGKMRRLEKATAKAAKPSGIDNGVPLQKATKKQKSEATDDVDLKAVEKAERAARMEALRKQKATARIAANGVKDITAKEVVQNVGARRERKTRVKAADTL